MMFEIELYETEEGVVPVADYLERNAEQRKA
jgi:hypothetical protein